MGIGFVTISLWFILTSLEQVVNSQSSQLNHLQLHNILLLMFWMLFLDLASSENVACCYSLLLAYASSSRQCLHLYLTFLL